MDRAQAEGIAAGRRPTRRGSAEVCEEKERDEAA
jgi:hypothetical protein